MRSFGRAHPTAWECPPKRVNSSGQDFQRFEQVEGADGAAGAVGLSVLAGEDQRGTVIAFDHAGGADADDAAVPVLAVDDHAVRVFHFRRASICLMNVVDDALLFLLAVAVELVQLQRHLGGPGAVLFGEQLDDALGDVHASGGVQARGDAKGDVAGTERARAVELAV